MDESTFLQNRQQALDYLDSLDHVFVFDGFANWDAEVWRQPAATMVALASLCRGLSDPPIILCFQPIPCMAVAAESHQDPSYLFASIPRPLHAQHAHKVCLSLSQPVCKPSLHA
jgi:hypothetical protein